MIDRILILLLFATALAASPARADTASVQTAWRLLDYIAVDYQGAVQDGKVVSKTEFTEMTEFAAADLIKAHPVPLAPTQTPVFDRGQVLADGGIRDLNAQFGQFRLDAATTPGRIGLPHPVNQPDVLTIDGGSSGASSGFPAPEAAEGRPMPDDDGPRLNDDQHPLPARPATQQQYP